MPETPPATTVVREEYDRISDSYATLYEGDGPLQHFYHTRLRLVAELLMALPRGTLLDVGSGPGIVGDHARALGFRYVAADASVGMARACRKRRQGQATAIAAAVEALPFDDGAFDVVTGLGVFEYVEALDGAFAECHRVLRPGGFFILSLLNRMSPYRAILRARQRRSNTDRIPAVQFGRSTALRMVARAGFLVRRVVPFDMEMLPPEFAENHPRIWRRVVRLFEPLSRTPLGRLSSAMLILGRRD